MFKEQRTLRNMYKWQWNCELYISIWTKNFSHSAYEKSEAKMTASDVQ